MNLASTVIPKSDQLNADDLIAGPRTITITDVKAGSSAEQPVSIHYQGDNGRPYKPCKSMRRVLIAIWGDDATVYCGRRLTLFCDPSVRFGADQTGGIRISHASDITEPAALALTVTRGKRKPYQVLPMPDAPDLQALEDIGNTKADQGDAVLQNWWMNELTAAERKALGRPRLEKWKERASAA